MSNYDKADFWAQKAQKEGYPARSVYKLQEIDEKFGVFSKNKNGIKLNILDLGAAPGSWSLYLLKKYAASIKLTSCDLCPLSLNVPAFKAPACDFVFLQGDFYSAEINAAIGARAPFNVIISDAAPATSGSSLVDAARSF